MLALVSCRTAALTQSSPSGTAENIVTCALKLSRPAARALKLQLSAAKNIN